MEKKNESTLEIIEAMAPEVPQEAVVKKAPSKSEQLETMSREVQALKDLIEEQKKQIALLEPSHLSPQRKALQKKIDAMREEGLTEIEGTFRNLENPGDYKEFVIRKFKGEGATKYKFEDNTRYRINRYVGEHINKQGKVAKHKRILDDDGQPVKVLEKFEYMYVFDSPDLPREVEMRSPIVGDARVR